MSIQRSLLASFLVALAAVPAASQAQGWLNLEGGRAVDYQRGSVSGGATLGPANLYLVEAAIGTALSNAGSPPADLRVNDYSLGLGLFPARHWDLSLNGDASFDTSDLHSQGLTGTLGLHGIPYTDGFWQPSMSVSGGLESYFKGNDFALQQNKAGLSLGVGWGPRFSMGASGTLYQYNQDLYGVTGNFNTQQPSNSGGFLPFLRPVVPNPRSTQSGQSSATVRNAFLFGFPTRDWSAGLGLTLTKGLSVSGDYTQVEMAGNGVWIKSVGAAIRSEIAEDFAAKIGWSKVVESGADSPFYSATITYYFGNAKN